MLIIQRPEVEAAEEIGNQCRFNYFTTRTRFWPNAR